jgi:hypothetical protein
VDVERHTVNNVLQGLPACRQCPAVQTAHFQPNPEAVREEIIPTIMLANDRAFQHEAPSVLTGIGGRRIGGIQLGVATPLTKGKVIQLINTYRCDVTSLKLHDKLGIETYR